MWGESVSSEAAMKSPKITLRTRFARASSRPQARVVPSVLSLMFHAALVLSLAISFRGGAGGGFGRGPAEFTTVITRDDGVVMANPWGDRPDAQVEGAPNDVPPGDLTAGSTAGNEVLQTTSTVANEAPPAELLLPTSDGPSKNDSGTRLPTGVASGASLRGDGGVSKSGTRPPATGTRGVPDGTVGGGAPGGGFGAGFFGTRDAGMKVVFVVDASGSMTSYNAMQVAKSELMASLQSLDERQQFLIIYYDDKPHVVKLKNESKPTLAPATEINKTLARQQIAGIQPGAGTDHYPAVELALKMNPDVIFFLTDAAEPAMHPADLEKIKRLNNGRAHIHSIELGVGPELVEYTSNFLRRLAQQNGGTHRYHDVTKLRGP